METKKESVFMQMRNGDRTDEGSFNVGLQKLFYLADARNKRKLVKAFPEFFGDEVPEFGITKSLKNGAEIITDERLRQIGVEGWDLEHDKIANTSEELVWAAVSYAIPEDNRNYEFSPRNLFPFDMKWWKPSPDNRIKELAKAGALIAAEIDRLQSDSNS